nr:alpha/beta hydrolase [Pullulanibacillus pueri]
MNKADAVSPYKKTRHTLRRGDVQYVGKVSEPLAPSKGVVIIVTPIDSAKEELFSYEQDFLRGGFSVVIFDGPGQGETVLETGHKASQQHCHSFLEAVIRFSHHAFPDLPLHLFGTSSGATWSLEGGKNPLISKVIAVSPATKHDIHMPDFFKERMENTLEDFNQGFLPPLAEREKLNQVVLFHGKEDVMVDKRDLLDLYENLSEPKRFIEYEGEGHCCNFKLSEIRARSMKWLKGEKIHGI